MQLQLLIDIFLVAVIVLYEVGWLQLHIVVVAIETHAKLVVIAARKIVKVSVSRHWEILRVAAHPARQLQSVGNDARGAPRRIELEGPPRILLHLLDDRRLLLRVNHVLLCYLLRR